MKKNTRIVSPSCWGGVKCFLSIQHTSPLDNPHREAGERDEKKIDLFFLLSNSTYWRISAVFLCFPAIIFSHSSWSLVQTLSIPEKNRENRKLNFKVRYRQLVWTHTRREAEEEFGKLFMIGNWIIEWKCFRFGIRFSYFSLLASRDLLKLDIENVRRTRHRMAQIGRVEKKFFLEG